MARAIDADKAIEVAQIKYNDWNLAMAAADGRREINLCFKKQELFKAVKAVIDCVPTLTPPNEWVSVEERLPEPGERVIATDGAFVGEGYMDCYGVWCRPNGMRWNMLDSEVTHWIPLPALPDRRPPEGET